METVLDGVNHIAILTRDMDRFIRFYQEAFDATVVHDNRNHGGHAGERMVILAIGGQSAFNVFEVPGDTQAHVQTPMFGRGRLDHFGLNARSRETFEQARTRLMHLDASDGTITDFGAALSVFFRDPDGLEAEVVWHKDRETRLPSIAPAKAACGIWGQGGLPLDAHEGACEKTSMTHYRRKCVSRGATFACARCAQAARQSCAPPSREAHYNGRNASMSTTQKLPSRLHHTAYTTKDMEKTRAFYEEVIGLPLVATWSESDELFGKVRTYCHCFFGLADGGALAFFQFADQDDERTFSPPIVETPFHHIALKVDQVTQEAIEQRLQAAGSTAPDTFVLEHGYCRSLYIKDPNGMLLEFTRDAPNAAQIAEERQADAHATLQRRLRGDHTSNNVYR